MEPATTTGSAAPPKLDAAAWAALPPGPRYSGLRTSLSYARDAYGFYDELRARYGKTFALATLHGPLVVTAEPTLVKELFAAPTESFRSWATHVLSPFLGEASLVLTHGERHRRDRRLLTPPFAGPRLRAYGDIIREATRRHAAELPLGRPTPVQPMMQEISLDVILRAVMGLREAAELHTWRTAILEDFSSVTPAIMFFPMLRRRFGGFGPWARYERARARFDALLLRTIRERRAEGGAADDILGLILGARYEDGTGMSDSDVRDQLVTLLVAGHETTATALTWAIEWLARLPEVDERLTAELAALGDEPTAEALTAAPYLDALCNETLRVNPIVPDIARDLLKPLRLGRWTIPAGVAVGVATTLLHTDPELYAEPQRFRPERWLGKTPSPFEFTPFGGGVRRCLGAAFATYEFKLALATIVRALRFAPVGPTPARAVRRNITIGPERGVVIVASKR